MSYVRMTVAKQNNGRMVTHLGHIKPHTAQKRQYEWVGLLVVDHSGKGRGETRYFYPPFDTMKPYF